MYEEKRLRASHGIGVAVPAWSPRARPEPLRVNASRMAPKVAGPPPECCMGYAASEGSVKRNRTGAGEIAGLKIGAGGDRNLRSSKRHSAGARCAPRCTTPVSRDAAAYPVQGGRTRSRAHDSRADPRRVAPARASCVESVPKEPRTAFPMAGMPSTLSLAGGPGLVTHASTRLCRGEET